jgi:hypothetical protein
MVMKRRHAVTLIEALMAIFVMAIGLLALLTLFPLGAVQMAHALKDERTAGSGMLAVSTWKSFDLGNDFDPTGTITTINSLSPPGQTIYRMFENPWPGNLPLMTTGVSTSYPIYVDPIGVTNGAAVPLGNVAFGIPRVSVSRLPQFNLATQPNALPGQTPAWAARWFTMPDDHTYADNGIPDNLGSGNPVPVFTAPNQYVGTNQLNREGRYTWAYMARRQTAMVPSPPPTPGAPPVPPINLTVVVYSGRSPGVNFAGNPLGETAYNVTFGPPPDNSPNIVRIDWTGQPQRPTLRRGAWVLDARMLPGFYVAGLNNIAPGAGLGIGSAGINFLNVPQGYFYRVVNVSDVPGQTQIDVEIQRPLGGQLRGPYGTTAGGGYYTGPLVVVENVSEVFEKETTY